MRNVKPVVAAALSVLLVISSGCAISGMHGKNPSSERMGFETAARQRVQDQKQIERYKKELSKLTALIRRLQERDSLLSAEIIDLKRTNARCKNLLDLQDRVLQLLDDKNNTVRTLLKEEAVKLNLPTRHPDGERTYCSFSESDLFDHGSTKIHAKGRKLLTSLSDELKTDRVKSLVIENNPCRAINESSDFLSAECSLSAARATAVAKFFSSGLNPAAGQVSFGAVISLDPDMPDPELDIHDNPERRIDVVLELSQ